MKTKRTYAPSKIIAVRYHLDEIKTLNKNRGRKMLSVYIREKSLDLTIK